MIGFKIPSFHFHYTSLQNHFYIPKIIIDSLDFSWQKNGFTKLFRFYKPI